MPSLALACRLSAATAAIQSLFKRAKSIARRYNEPLLAIEDDFLELGPELVVNGSILDGWTTTSPGSYSESGGRIVIADAGGTAGIYQDLPTEIGKTYVASIDAECTTTAQLGVFVGVGFATQLATTTNITTRGVQRLVFVATTNSIRVYYRETGGVGGIAYAKDISVREILSAQVYQDSAGTLPATIGSPIGLLSDRSFGGELRSELFSDANASFVGEASRVSPGVYRILSTAGAYSVVNLINNPAGKTFEVSFNVDSVTVAGTGLSIDPGAVPVSADVGSKRAVLVSASTPIGIKRTGAACDIQISNISVRELKGHHATQATAGNRPILSQVPKRLGVELSSYASGFSSTSGIATVETITTLSGSELVITSQSANDSDRAEIPISGLDMSKKYSVEIVARRGAQGTQQTVRASTSLDIPLTLISSTTSTPYRFVVSAIATSGIIRVYSSDASGAVGDSVVVSSISVREVLEWTPAASFNGTTNSLRLATNPIGSNLSQPYTVIVAGVVGALGAVRGFCGDGVRYFRIFEDGVVGPSHAGIGRSLTTATLSAGQPYVVEMAFTGSACSVWINGILAINNAPFSPPTISTASSFFIGHRGTGSEFFNGQLTAVTAFDRVLSDSERTTIGKAFAKELGVTYG